MNRPWYLFYFIVLIAGVNVAQAQRPEIEIMLQQLSSAQGGERKVDCLNRLGQLYRPINADSCLSYGMRAQQLAQSINYSEGVVDSEHLIGYGLFRRGLYAESLEMLSKSASYYQAKGRTEKLVRVYLDIAEVQNKDISDRADIIALLQKTKHIGEAIEKDSIMSSVYMSYLTRNTTLPDDSIHYYLEKAAEIANRYDDKGPLLYYRLWQARFWVLDGQIEIVLPEIQAIIADAQRWGQNRMQINAHFLMMVGYRENNLQLALDHCYQALEVNENAGDRSLRIYILNQALAIAKDMGNQEEIISIYDQLEKAMTAEWENSRKFMGDYIRHNAIESDNRLLNAQNAKRSLWLIIVVFCSAFIVLTIYIINLRRNKKAKEQIDALNYAVDVHIINMEEEKQRAIKEEQKRLGQDLHDGLAPTLASINHQLELLILDTDDVQIKQRLNTLKSIASDAYETSRNKSHEWFYLPNKQGEGAFEAQIKSLIDSALPNSRYKKNILIDDDIIKQLGMDTRIAFLRIIRESVTNIIKHAKATVVEILLYQEARKLFLSIKDNGKGMINQLSPGIGLRSIKRYVETMDGTTSILSDDNGTEIIIVIPCASILSPSSMDSVG